jgi:hypothetical protein
VDLLVQDGLSVFPLVHQLRSLQHQRPEPMARDCSGSCDNWEIGLL